MRDLWRCEVERIGARVADADALRTLLARHVPAPYRVAGGTIVDRRGRRSAPVAAALLEPAHPFTVEPGADGALLFADFVRAAFFVGEGAEAVASVRALERGEPETPGGVIIGGGEAPRSILCIAVASSADDPPAAGAPDVVVVPGRGLRGQVAVEAGDATLAVLLAVLPGLLSGHPGAFAEHARPLGLELQVAGAPAPVARSGAPAPGPGVLGPSFAAEIEAAAREVAAARAEAEQILAAAQIETDRAEAAARGEDEPPPARRRRAEEAEDEPPPFV